MATLPRTSGILLHPTSLPDRCGIGSLGSEAYRFADFLAGAGQRFWALLPLGPTLREEGNAPYHSVSTFAGNPLLISLDKLAEEGLLESSDLERAALFPEKRVDYDRVVEFKVPLLVRSYHLFQSRSFPKQKREFEAFCEKNSPWLDDYALFMALKEARGRGPWQGWDKKIREREGKTLERLAKELAEEVRCHKYLQFQFFRQWSALRDYCHDRGLGLIGDLPHFVALDSAEVWAKPSLFRLDPDGAPTAVAGVPPDYFSESGQLWGNPIYRWDAMAEDGYAWWVERLRATFSLVDLTRLDHFRGFEKYWEVPAQETTAMNGRWAEGPGAKLFEAARKALGELPIIAEDLGLITPEVDALREELGFAGMRVLQFAFDEDEKNVHKPYNYPRNCVVYTGTHDNDTTVGWFKGKGEDQESREKRRRIALGYLGTRGKEIHWDLIRLALSSVADLAVIPLQDLLGLGSEARMNLPGTTRGNWEWRFTFEMLKPEIGERLRQMVVAYGRGK